MRSINRNILFRLDTFLDDIEENILCPFCGEKCFGGVCDYCGKKNENLINIFNDLTEYLKTIDDNLLKDSNLNLLLNKIFQFKKYGIGLIYIILSNAKYEETVKNTCSRINNNYPEIIHDQIKLTKEEYDLLVNLPLNNSYISNETLVNICSIALVNKDNNLDKKLSNCKKIIKKFTRYIQNNNVDIDLNFIDSNKMRCELGDAKAFYNMRYIDISNKRLEEDPFYVYSVIFHELIHKHQDDNLYKYQVLSEETLMQIMDKILIRELGNDYFNDNRYWNSIELEARAFQYRDLMAYFNNFYIDVPDNFREIANERQDAYIKFINSKDKYIRKYKGKNVSVYKLFIKCLSDNNKYLKLYPQLEFLYKIKGSQVVEKTKEELEEDYDKFRCGELSWNGDKLEINNLYKKYINDRKVSNNEEEVNNSNNKSSGYSGVWLLTLLSGLFTTILFLFMTFLFK